MFARYEDPVAVLASATRAFLLEVLPGALEEVDPSAGLVGFGLGPGYKGNVCSILLSKKGVKLAFNRGAELPDPDGLLEGTGKVHRYVVLRSQADLSDPSLRALLNLAAEACRTRMSQR